MTACRLKTENAYFIGNTLQVKTAEVAFLTHGSEFALLCIVSGVLNINILNVSIQVRKK